MAQLILLNGPPGVGKSTVAGRYATEHPGTLCCDIDVLRTMIGGWEDDYGAAGGLIRPAALGLITAYLRESGDVVLPQLIARASELAKFERAASDAGAEFVHVLLMTDSGTSLDRYERRATDRPHLRAAHKTVDADGGAPDVIGRYRDALVALAHDSSGTRFVDAGGDPEDTYARVLAAIGP